MSIGMQSFLAHEGEIEKSDKMELLQDLCNDLETQLSIKQMAHMKAMSEIETLREKLVILAHLSF